MENLNKELDRLAKSIVDRAERLSNEFPGEYINEVYIKAAEALAIISNTKALNLIVWLSGKKEKPVTEE